MGCVKLIKGQDLECVTIFNKYYQNIILMNKADVESFSITSTDIKHRINFNLKAGKVGFLFTSSEAGVALSANFNKSVDDGIQLYNHQVELPIVGVTENEKTLLKQLDASDCFASIQFRDGTVEIYGFNYLLKTNPYNYEPQSGVGGASITMSSKYKEYDPPYKYVPKFLVGGKNEDEQANEDFNNLFGNIPFQDTGDFNDDFNDDFNIT